MNEPGLISRVADSCMWFGRYVERSEAGARELRATLNLALDGALMPRQLWQPVIIVAGEEAAFRSRFGDVAIEDGEAVQRYLVWDEGCTVSLRRSVRAARENARSIRDVLSGEAWETVNGLYLWLASAAGRSDYQSHRDGFYQRVRESTQLTLGLLRSTMLHDTVLDFVWLGVLLERVGQTARLLDVHHHAFAVASVDQPHQVVETSLWMSLVRALSGTEPFLRVNAGRVNGQTVTQFLVGEARFPRSIAYCVRSAYERLCAIRPPQDTKLPGGEAVARLADLDEWVRNLGTIPAEPGALHAVLTHVVDETAAICETIGRELLGYGAAPPSVSASES